MTLPLPSRMTRRAARAVALRDEDKVRKASISVGVAVAIAAGSVVLVGLLILVVLALSRSVNMPTVILETTNHPWVDPFDRPVPRFGWMNADEIVRIVAVLAIIMVVLTAIVGWLAARRAVKPLADALALQRHFVADASHELRTPLTALSSRIQILQRRLESGRDVAPVVAQLQTDAEAMTYTLNDLLLTAGGATGQGTAVSVAHAIEQAMTSLLPQAEKSGVTCAVTVDQDPMAAIPSSSLTRAIVAIVDNAIQHSPQGGVVEVSATVEARTAVIRIRDQGQGITGVDPDRIFDRFAHGAETGKRRSFGLGLALASEVAHRFRGDLVVESTGPDGTCFALSFPNIGRSTE